MKFLCIFEFIRVNHDGPQKHVKISSFYIDMEIVTDLTYDNVKLLRKNT
jgi:hypothetical protein